MKDGSCQSRIRLSVFKNLHKVARITCAAGGNDRNTDGNRHAGCQHAVKSISGAVAVNGSQEDLAGASIFRCSCSFGSNNSRVL